jgi:hypothetical protein
MSSGSRMLLTFLAANITHKHSSLPPHVIRLFAEHQWRVSDNYLYSHKVSARNRLQTITIIRSGVKAPSTGYSYECKKNVFTCYAPNDLPNNLPH